VLAVDVNVEVIITSDVQIQYLRRSWRNKSRTVRSGFGNKSGKGRDNIGEIRKMNAHYDQARELFGVDSCSTSSNCHPTSFTFARYAYRVASLSRKREEALNMSLYKVCAILVVRAGFL